MQWYRKEVLNRTVTGWEGAVPYNGTGPHWDIKMKSLVFHDTRYCQIIWQIESHTEQNKFRQKLSPVGFELITFRSSVPCSPNCAREDFVGDVWSELSFVPCTTSHVGFCLFLESIEHGFIKALMIHKDNQTVRCEVLKNRSFGIWYR